LYEITFGYNKTCKISIQGDMGSAFAGKGALTNTRRLDSSCCPFPDHRRSSA